MRSLTVPRWRSSIAPAGPRRPLRTVEAGGALRPYGIDNVRIDDIRLRKEHMMDRRDILAERPVERGRGFMPGVSVNPSRVLFTAGLTGRNPDGSLVAGGMAPQTHRTFERLQAVLAHAGAKFDDAVKQLVYVTDLEAY